ncbi:GNAT family N-acetyltransferase [Yoonia sp. SS1-5]|uniref:N-acetyltransferase family protein n=1 Tax=Yoonia rhodophyticola TaxID=3137370 RepID=A0AAN0ML12_9RHOB
MIIRPATATDLADLTHVINEIIALGGSTAHQRPFDQKRMQDHYVAPPSGISCQVAEDNGRVIGFQSLLWPRNDSDPLPAGWATIASFVASQAAGKGVGQKLFAATRQAAAAAGVTTIDATIRADNVAGLRYYTGLGFADYDRLVAIPLRDGTVVDRIRKRFDLSMSA